MPSRWTFFLFGALALLTPSIAAAQLDREDIFALAAVRRGRADYAEMRLQQVLCELPARDSANSRLVAMFDTARARHLDYARTLLSYIEARRPSRQLRREVAGAAARADSTMLSFDEAVRDTMVRVRGIPSYELAPLISMVSASNLVRSLYRGGSLDPERIRRELDPPNWKSVAEVRSTTNCTHY
jgi:hypothetical protein